MPPKGADEGAGFGFPFVGRAVLQGFALRGEFLFHVEKEPKDAGGRRRGELRSTCRLAPRLPLYGGRQLGRMVRYRKGAGGSVERPPLVFRWRWPGCNRKPELPWLRVPLLRRGSSCAEGNGGYGSRCVFLVGPDALIGPFPGGPVCRPYKGDRNLIPYPARATERVAPTSTCLKPDGRVRTPAPTAYTETIPSFVGAGHRPARRLHSSCHLPGSAWHRNSDSHGVKKTGGNEKNAW